MAAQNALQSIAGFALRLVAGTMLAFHGAQKLFSLLLPPGHHIAVGSQLWFGGIIELVCGSFVAIGLFTRPAALLASGTMAVAYFQFHWKFEMTNWKFLPAINQGELAALYCFVFLLFAVSGPGVISFDRLRGRA